MAEPSRSDPLNRLSNFVRTAPSFVSCREEFAWLRNILQEVLAGQRRVVLLPGEAGIGKTQEPQELRSGALRHGLQVGFDRGYGELISLSLSFVEISQAMLDPPSLEIERTLSINLQDRVELHYWAGLAYRRDQAVEPCLAHCEDAIEVHRLASNIRGLAEGLQEKTETNLTLAAAPLSTMGDPQPLYDCDTEFPPVWMSGNAPLSNCR
jgi:hypothetical protein